MMLPRPRNDKDWQFRKHDIVCSQETKLAYSDSPRMHKMDILRRRPPSPPWTASDAKMCCVIAEMSHAQLMANRAFPQEEFDADPFAFVRRCQEKLKAKAARFGQYTGPQKKVREVYYIHLENFPALLTAVFYLSFRHKLLSPDVSREVGGGCISPVCIRQWLSRANAIARRRWPDETFEPPAWCARKDYMERINRPRKPTKYQLEYEEFLLRDSE